MKISWSKALKDYLKDESLSYAKIAEKYGVSESQVTRVAIEEGWQELRQQTLENARRLLPEKIGDEIAEVNARHIKLAKILQGKGIEAMTDKKDEQGKLIPGLKPKHFKDAREAIDSGVKIERGVLGLDKAITQNNTQNNNYVITLSEFAERIRKRKAEDGSKLNG